jgi:hypothetical protein
MPWSCRRRGGSSARHRSMPIAANRAARPHRPLVPLRRDVDRLRLPACPRQTPAGPFGPRTAVATAPGPHGLVRVDQRRGARRLSGGPAERDRVTRQVSWIARPQINQGEPALGDRPVVLPGGEIVEADTVEARSSFLPRRGTGSVLGRYARTVPTVSSPPRASGDARSRWTPGPDASSDTARPGSRAARVARPAVTGITVRSLSSPAPDSTSERTWSGRHETGCQQLRDAGSCSATGMPDRRSWPECAVVEA